MVSMILLIPIIALLFATVSFLFVVRIYWNKPWGLKIWLLVFAFGWIPWSGFTVLMRLADSEYMAQIYLRASFISLQILSYAVYRFHYLLMHKMSSNRLATFGLAILTGFNISMSFNSQMLGVLYIDGYWVDQFSLQLLTTNLLLNFTAGWWAVKTLRQMNVFSSFYNEKGSNYKRILTSFVIIFLMPVFLVLWMLNLENSHSIPDSTIFILISIPVTSFVGYTYGFHPISEMLAPQRLWSFIIINQSGLPIYEKNFGINDSISDVTLFSGAINVTNIIIKRQFGSASAIELISLDDRAILIAQREGYLFCLVVDHSTHQLQYVLENLTDQIYLHDGFTKIVDRQGAISGGQYIDSLLTKLLSAKRGV